MVKVLVGVVAIALLGQGCKKSKGDKVIEIVRKSAHDMCDCSFDNCGIQVKEGLFDALYNAFAGEVKGEDQLATFTDELGRYVRKQWDFGAEKEMSAELLQILPGNLDSPGLVGAMKKLIICTESLKSNHP